MEANTAQSRSRFDEARLLRSGQPAGSKSITAWREKKPSYKGNLNRICRGTFFITADIARVVCLQYGPTEHILS